jgi:hypothetical protein
VHAIEKVVETWAVVRTIPNYELVVGTLLFQEYE